MLGPASVLCSLIARSSVYSSTTHHPCSAPRDDASDLARSQKQRPVHESLMPPGELRRPEQGLPASQYPGMQISMCPIIICRVGIRHRAHTGLRLWQHAAARMLDSRVPLHPKGYANATLHHTPVRTHPFVRQRMPLTKLSATPRLSRNQAGVAPRTAGLALLQPLQDALVQRPRHKADSASVADDPDVDRHNVCGAPSRHRILDNFPDDPLEVRDGLQ